MDATISHPKAVGFALFLGRCVASRLTRITLSVLALVLLIVMAQTGGASAYPHNTQNPVPQCSTTPADLLDLLESYNDTEWSDLWSDLEYAIINDVPYIAYEVDSLGFTYLAINDDDTNSNFAYMRYLDTTYSSIGRTEDVKNARIDTSTGEILSYSVYSSTNGNFQASGGPQEICIVASSEANLVGDSAFDLAGLTPPTGLPQFELSTSPNYNDVIQTVDRLGFVMPRDGCYLGASYGSSPATYCTPDNIPNSSLVDVLTVFHTCQNNVGLNTTMNHVNAVRAGGSGGYALVALNGSNDGSGDGLGGEYAGVRIVTWSGTPSLVWYHDSGSNYLGITGTRSILELRIDRLGSNPTCQPYYNMTYNTTSSSTPTILSTDFISSFALPANVLPVGYGGVNQTKQLLAEIKGSYDPNYPAEYDGQPLPDEFVVPYYSNNYTDFEAITSSYTVRGIYNGSPYDDPKCTFITWRWVLVEDIEDGYDPGDVQEVLTRIDQEFMVVAPESGFFRLDANWTWFGTAWQADLDGFPLDPNDLDYCYPLSHGGSISELASEGLLPSNSGKVFPVDGFAREVFGFTPNRECYIDEQPHYETGFWPPVSLCIYQTSWTMKDCSVYDVTELGDRFGCELNNVFSTLRAWLLELFIPTPSNINNIFQSLANDIQNQTSFLTYPLAFFIDVMADVTDQPNSCIIEINGIYDSSSSWDLCRMKNDWPTAWTFVVTVFRMGFVLLLLIGTYKAFNNLWKAKQ